MNKMFYSCFKSKKISTDKTQNSKTQKVVSDEKQEATVENQKKLLASQEIRQIDRPVDMLVWFNSFIKFLNALTEFFYYSAIYSYFLIKNICSEKIFRWVEFGFFSLQLLLVIIVFCLVLKFSKSIICFFWLNFV